MSLGSQELILIFVLVLLLFGPNRLPELARSLGKGMREFKKVTGEFQNQLAQLGEHDEPPRRNAPPATSHRATAIDDNAGDDNAGDVDAVHPASSYARELQQNNDTAPEDAAALMEPDPIVASREFAAPTIPQKPEEK